MADLTDSLPPVPFAEIRDQAAVNAEAICRRWLPHGRKAGAWWVAPVPWRPDKNPSLIVSLTTGHWEDRARGDKGDLISLYGKMYGAKPVEAARAVARVIGHEFGRTGGSTVARG